MYFSKMDVPISMEFSSEDQTALLLDYITIDADIHMKTKTVTSSYEPSCPEECPIQYSTLLEEPYPDLAMKPVAIYKDPFRKGKHKLVLCDLMNTSRKSHVSSKREQYKEMLLGVMDDEPWFGFEQEFFFVDDHEIPHSWYLYTKDPKKGYNNALFGGRHAAIQRNITELHMKACMYAGLKMYGMNREDLPSEWEYQTGPLPAMEAADQLHVSRYILQRLCEMHGVGMTFSNPQCIKSTGIRCTLHVNFSTKQMRNDGGYKYILEAIENLSMHSQEDLLKKYDLNNGMDAVWRLSGDYVSKPDEFVCTVGEKLKCSVRIPLHVSQKGKGYFEERRVSGDANPYDVCHVFLKATLRK